MKLRIKAGLIAFTLIIAQTTMAETSMQIPKCDSLGIAAQIKERISDKGVELLDIGKLKELGSNNTMRYCVAAVSLSTGYDGPMSYSVLLESVRKH